MSALDQRIAEAERELASLKQEKEAKDNMFASSENLAEWLHGRLCRQNHTDGCGWFYTTWNTRPVSHARERYLTRATEIKQFFRQKGIEDALAVELLQLFYGEK